MRNTQATQKIYDIIKDSEIALSHSEVQNMLPEGFCDRATIYRVLERLAQKGSIHKIVNVDGVINYAACEYAANTPSATHVHFNCERCQTVTCLEEIKPNFTLPKNYKIHQSNFVLSGICPNCSAN
ncbi:Fur family transcriptional regulator [Aequorivita echinoideorum]|uniref:Transcriptional repressor n=1 Tax=Aequorivita echinoideorum TaxID=1549647 RepID=A0ABS5S4P2_9FLAO|nr:transcriptional repressor [Aequorivita echinoideorum]MBT0607364.1 transcriptional repressor [Aequorivita echinoideorum]